MGSSPGAIVRPEEAVLPSRCNECGATRYEASGARASVLDSRPLISNSTDAADICRGMARFKQERFRVLALDVRLRLIRARTIAIGSLTVCPVEPREIFGWLMRLSANAAVVCHNHPSGDSSPSDQDQVLTHRLVEVGELVGIRLLDHVIITRSGDHFSFAAAGKLRT